MSGSDPEVFKNAIDWLSRPASDIARVFGDHPVGVIAATPSRDGSGALVDQAVHGLLEKYMARFARLVGKPRAHASTG